jgi:hypothetical protein
MRNDLFTMRVNETERQMIVAIAVRLQRTQSDAVRLLIREAARELETQTQTANDNARKVVNNAIAG